MAGIESYLQKQSIITWLKNASPSLYRVAFNSYFRIRAFIDMPRYILCRLTKSVYFGPVMLGAQTWKSRDPHMRKTILQELTKHRDGDFYVLEIGSWAGQSAILWATEIARSGCSGKVVCVDPWMPFASKEQIGVNSAISIMDNAARHDRIFPLFWHNVKSSGLAHHIIPLRGRSSDVLRLLRTMSFDLVFVDGSHTFSDFVSDLALAAPLVKESGIICGDDLELQQDQIDFPYAEKNREKDFLTDPTTGQDFHPGVCLGVGHFFKRRVSCCDGFWLLRKVGDSWGDVD